MRVVVRTRGFAPCCEHGFRSPVCLDERRIVDDGSDAWSRGPEARSAHAMERLDWFGETPVEEIDRSSSCLVGFESASVTLPHRTRCAQTSQALRTQSADMHGPRGQDFCNLLNADELCPFGRLLGREGKRLHCVLMRKKLDCDRLNGNLIIFRHTLSRTNLAQAQEPWLTHQHSWVLQCSLVRTKLSQSWAGKRNRSDWVRSVGMFVRTIYRNRNRHMVY